MQSLLPWIEMQGMQGTTAQKGGIMKRITGFELTFADVVIAVTNLLGLAVTVAVVLAILAATK